MSTHSKSSLSGGKGGHVPAFRKSRFAAWFVGLAAIALTALSVSGYAYDRKQLELIAAAHLRLLATGPAVLETGAPAEYSIAATSITGEPLRAQIELSLNSSDGKRFVYKETTDDAGGLRVAIPDDMPMGLRAELRVAAVHGGQREEIKTVLAVAPPRYDTQLTLDRPIYAPGETIFYRSLTLSRFALKADRPMPIQFELLDPSGAAAAKSTVEGITDRGVGQGAFTLREHAAEGRWTLVARSMDGVFAEQKRTFLVRRPDDAAKQESSHGEPSKTEKTAARGSEKSSRSDKPEKLEVEFFPEGGDLAEGLENRVYFSSRDADGKPVPFNGVVVDDRGAEVAECETLRGGMGSFSFAPRGGRSYHLKITSPAGIALQPKLPPANGDQKIVLNAGSGVVRGDGPLTFSLRASQAGMPLAAAAWLRGVLVGQQALVTTLTGRGGSQGVVIPLDEQVGGVIQLVIYNYGVNPPQPVAQRLLYRQMERRLTVKVLDRAKRYAPGETVNLTLTAADEKGRPAEVFGAAVVDQAALGKGGESAANPTARFLFPSPLDKPDSPWPIESALADDKDAAAAMDLLLGTQASGKLTEKPLPLFLSDNLGEIRAKYEKSRDEYQQKRTQRLRAVAAICFFAGLGLPLLLALLGLLRVTSGVWLWLPTLTAAACAVLLGLLLLDPRRHKNEEEFTAAFTPYEAPLPPDSEVKPPLTLSEILRAAHRSSSDDASWAMIRGELPKDIEKYRFKGGVYAYRREAGATAGRRDRAETIYWNPFAIAAPDGRVQVHFDLPDRAAVYRLLIDAHGDGRLGSGQAELVVGPPEEKKK